MKKAASFVAFIISGILFVFPSFVNAEIIRNFSSEIGVFPDSSLVIKEKITYDFEGALRHGINRDIPLGNKNKDNLEIDVMSVLDKDGKPCKFTTGVKDGILNIKIGDAGVIISGEKIYEITYKVRGAIDYYADFDEVYWNVTGNSWDEVIESSEVKIILPKDVFSKERKCYYGIVGSRTPCRIFDEKTFQSERALLKGEGMTVAVSFNKGVVLEYKSESNGIFISIVDTFWPILIPLIAFGLMFYRWFKKGRDPKGREIIKPEYEAPKDLSPIEVGGIMHEAIKSRSISAQIIDLAIRGYIKIKPTEEKLLGIRYKQDYELTLLMEIGYLENDFDKEIIRAIFGDNPTVGGIAMISALDNLFYKSVPRISGRVIDSLLKKKYYFNFPKNILGETILIVMTIFFIFFSLGFLIWSSVDFQDPRKIAAFFTALIVSVSLAITFNLLMPSKTQRGVLMKEYLLGLKEYLQIAEKDRLAFHNAPEKKPEVFEILLPYAIVFGVEDLWAKEFEGVFNKEPSWYESGRIGFTAAAFGKDLLIFDTVMSSSISSTPSSGPGVSSGISGGGVGGGGGGSW